MTSETVPDDGIQGFSRRALKVLVSGSLLLPNQTQRPEASSPITKLKHRRSKVRGEIRSSFMRMTTQQRPTGLHKKQAVPGPSRSRSSKARREKKRALPTLSLKRHSSIQNNERCIVAQQRVAGLLHLKCSDLDTLGIEEVSQHEGKRFELAKVVSDICETSIGAANSENDVAQLVPDAGLPIAAPRLRLPAVGQPSVWADTRQELCEGLPYFRAYQSGLYSHHNVAFGYLLDGFGSTRDHIGSRVIISHGGGKGGSSGSNSGLHELADDQNLTDRSVSALLNNYRQQQPLVLIMGSKATASPAVIPHRYCVLDWFRVSHYWTEREGDSNPHVRYKFRFEKLSNENGWWSAPSEVSKDQSQKLEPIREIECQSCRTVSPVIYQIAICFNPTCAMYWHLGALCSTQLVLNESARDATMVTDIIPPCALRPLVVNSKDFYNGSDVSRVCWRAFCCPDCGKLNSRILFDRWECSSCGHTVTQERKVYRVAEVRDPFRPVYTGPPLSFDWLDPHSILQTHTSSTAKVKVIQYYFGPDIGSVYHVSCSNAENAVADNLFHDYQTQKIDFRRRLLKTRVEGYLLSAQFSHNAGVRYKYHAETGTESFDQCAPVITSAKDLITKRVAQALGPQCFNEVLSVAYFEGQHMGYHDDGEPGVAPVVASLSLGSVATMKFRPKKGQEHHFFNESPQSCSQNGPNRGSADHDEDANIASGDKPPRKDVLRLHLEHGDVMVMQGENFQRLVEHAVVPKGFRIAATARYIT